MRRTILTIVLAVGMSLASFAQVNFGVKAGLNMTSMSGDKSIEDLFKNRNGFYLGPTLLLQLSGTGFAIDLAALYDQRNADIEVERLAGGKATEEVNQKTFQVPINLRYGIGLGDFANVFVFAGPQFGFNLGSNSKDLFGMYEWKLSSSTVSANIGLGALIAQHLQLSFNYNIALGKTGEVTLKDGASAVWDTVVGKAKSNAWQIAMTYYF